LAASAAFFAFTWRFVKEATKEWINDEQEARHSKEGRIAITL
jgi:hypothetical protein